MLPTALGNALRSAEDSAGTRYGLAAITVFPRLYGLVDDPVRAEYASLVDQYDSSAHLAASLTVATPVCTAIGVYQLGAIGLLGLGLLPLAWVFYRHSEAAGLSGDLLHTIIDLHRFDLLARLRVPLPATPQEERYHNVLLSRWLADPPRPVISGGALRSRERPYRGGRLADDRRTDHGAGEHNRRFRSGISIVGLPRIAMRSRPSTWSPKDRHVGPPRRDPELQDPVDLCVAQVHGCPTSFTRGSTGARRDRRRQSGGLPEPADHGASLLGHLREARPVLRQRRRDHRRSRSEFGA